MAKSAAAAVQEEKPKSKGPKSIDAALKAQGVEASRISMTIMEPEALTLVEDPEHPLYDPRVKDPVDPVDPFVASIRAHGVRVPVMVRRNGEDRNGKPILQVVAGRQRVKVLRWLNAHEPLADGTKRKLKVDFVKGGDGDMALLALDENHQRRDETPFSRAVKMSKAQACGKTLEEIAAACRYKTVQPVKDHLELLSFIPEVQEAFNGELPIGAVKTFAKVPREEQAAVLTVVRGSGAKTKLQVAAAVDAGRKGVEYVAPDTSVKQTKMWSRDKVNVLKQKLEARKAALAEVMKRGADATGKNAEDFIANAPSTRELEACISLVSALLGDASKLEQFPHLQAVVAEVAVLG